MPIYMDFVAILTIATFISGLIWAMDACFFRARRLKKAQSVAKLDQMTSEPATTIKEPKIVEYARSFFPILLVVLILRSFSCRAFSDPNRINETDFIGRRFYSS